MQVPEKLALIGGSILLSSTLIFTLKSQASQIIPSVGHSISHVFDHIGDAQKSSDFNSNFKDAQKNGQKTGQWGTSKYYIGKDYDLHIGKGRLVNDTYNIIGSKTIQDLRSISIDQPVQLPNGCDYLFANIPNMTHINGIYNLDTSQVNDFSMMFNADTSLQTLDLSSFDTSKVGDIFGIFAGDIALRNVNVNGWDMHNVKTSAWAFDHNASLTNLDLSSWRIPDLNNAYNGMFASDNNLKNLNIENINFAPNIYWENNVFGNSNVPDGMFGDDAKGGTDNLSSLTLGKDSTIHGAENLPDAVWQNGSQVLHTHQLFDGNNHAGTWIKK